jgi:hypothetical protein
MGHRYAYVIGTGTSAEEARANAKEGALKIKFHLAATDGTAGDAAKPKSGPDKTRVHAGMDYFASNVVYEAE